MFVRIAKWKHWDSTALISSILVFILFVWINSIAISDMVYGLLVFGAVLILSVGTFFSWRKGDARLALTGGLLIITGFLLTLPMVQLMIACLSGNCI